MWQSHSADRSGGDAAWTPIHQTGPVVQSEGGRMHMHSSVSIPSLINPLPFKSLSVNLRGM